MAAVRPGFRARFECACLLPPLLVIRHHLNRLILGEANGHNSGPFMKTLGDSVLALTVVGRFRLTSVRR